MTKYPQTKVPSPCPYCAHPLAYEQAIEDHHVCPHCRGAVVHTKPIKPPGPWYWDKREAP